MNELRPHGSRSAAPAWLPHVLFVLGKGGVGRSSVATALAFELARRGERTLVFGWTLRDPIGPWFGLPPAGLMPERVAARVYAGNYRLEPTLELYFARHLRLPRFYRHVIRSPHVRKLIDAAQGIAELFFVGHLWWLSTLAADEADLHFDRIIVDAPATGHAASLFDMSPLLSSLRATGLLGVESERVVRMMSDPVWTGAVVVALPEELSAEETLDLVPAVTQRLGRRPLAVLVNRSVRGAVYDVDRPSALDEVARRLSPPSRAALQTVHDELRGRARVETRLRAALADRTEHGIFSLGEQLVREGRHEPRDVVEALRDEIGAHLGEGP